LNALYSILWKVVCWLKDRKVRRLPPQKSGPKWQYPEEAGVERSGLENTYAFGVYSILLQKDVKKGSSGQGFEWEIIFQFLESFSDIHPMVLELTPIPPLLETVSQSCFEVVAVHMDVSH